MSSCGRPGTHRRRAGTLGGDAMSDLLFNPTHLMFDRDGTCYDLVLVNDPYGGVLVVWPATGYLWRWHAGDRLKQLSPKCNSYDAENIYRFLESLDDAR